MVNLPFPIVTRAEARAAGLKRFFTGEPCINGHVSEQYVSGKQCCECNNAAFRAYRDSNLAGEKNRRKAYYQKTKDKERIKYRNNVEQLSRQQKAYYRANAKRIRAKAQAKRRENLDLYLLKERQWRKKNITKVRRANSAWLKSNPVYRKVKKHRRRAKERNAPGSHTVADIESLYKAQHERCAICFKKLGGKYTVDHIIALARGGSNDVTNLQIACRSCNGRKSAKDPIAFARELGRLL